MRVRFYCLLILFTFFLKSSLSQTSKKQMMDRYKQLTAIPFSELKQGKHLELAEIYSLKKFIELYIKHGKSHYNKKDGRTEIIETFSDSLFIYFTKQRSFSDGKFVVNFFKVDFKELYNINYLALERDSLQKQFEKEVVPEKDKDEVTLRKKNKGGVNMPESYTINFEYLNETKQIKTTYKWKVDNLYAFKNFKKIYTAYYDLKTNSFVK